MVNRTTDGTVMYQYDVYDLMAALGIEADPADLLRVQPADPDAEVDPDMIIFEVQG